MSRYQVWLSVALLCGMLAGAPAGGAQSQDGSSMLPLSFEERVAFQRAIEEVYLRHRLWPPENPDPKPPLDEVMPEAAIRAKVERYLLESELLGSFWRRPITAEQLQAEMDRMARQTRQPEVLAELFAALGNDAYVVAECLARPLLADHLIRGWYAGDDRLHEDTEQQARAALHQLTLGAETSIRGAVWRDEILVTNGHRDSQHGESAVQVLTPSEYEERLGTLAMSFGVHPVGKAVDAIVRSLPVGRVTELVETADVFSAVILRDTGLSRTHMTTFEWPKRPFEEWLQARRADFGVTALPGVASVDTRKGPGARLQLPQIVGSSSCGNDTWSPTDIGAPVARENAESVWTGSEMVVWGGGTGGTGSSSRFNTGGRYNPATDRWTDVTTTNAPTRRLWHVMVWTGSHVVVWGGDGGDSYWGEYQDSGGRYDPLSDSWTAVSTTGAPQAASGSSVVWTGTEMIVWGGESRHPAEHRWAV